MAQSEWVAKGIEGSNPGTKVELLTIRTKGDRVLDVSLSKVGGKGLFVKEIEEAILDGSADLAVHSLKDVPTELPDGLGLVCIGGASDPRDVLISRDGIGLADLPAESIIGTSSLRRQAQLSHARPDLRFRSIRGNIDTRLRKLADGEADAIILAAAGLLRLGLDDRITEYLPVELSVPAVGQGLLAVEARVDDDLSELLGFMSDRAATIRAIAERTALADLGGGCQTPIGIHATVDGDALSAVGMLANEAGDIYSRASVTGSAADPESVGHMLAAKLS